MWHLGFIFGTDKLFGFFFDTTPGPRFSLHVCEGPHPCPSIPIHHPPNIVTVIPIPIIIVIIIIITTNTSSSVESAECTHTHIHTETERALALISVTYIHDTYGHPCMPGTAHHTPHTTHLDSTRPLISQQKAGNQYFIQIYRYRLYSLLYSRGYTIPRAQRTNGITTQTQISARRSSMLLIPPVIMIMIIASLLCPGVTNIDYLLFCFVFEVITELLSHAEMCVYAS
ncbi:hypothetical protein F4860DRAFT_497205 [Xylaria cubensis]|nr:hypothetical protein F4860DRAFT_497205 [Xylaria cubensis]